MKKTVVCFLFVIFVLVGGKSLFGQGMMRQGGFSMHHYFMHARNLQLLHPRQAQQAMIHFAESLSVKCNFCHNVGPEADADSIKRDSVIQGDFALDDPQSVADKDVKKSLGHKARAREMVRMVNYDNQNFLDWKHSSGRQADKVNCWLCHRGKHDKMVSDHKEKNKDFVDLY
ncbi:MAG: hypothetical protein JRG73_02130 [Deltaproteobacteria bacterium]|nr:hypothetical protein [Deltaproteobacteria bacterium]